MTKNHTEVINTGPSIATTTVVENTTITGGEVITTVVPTTIDFQIVRNPVTNEVYHVYTNGTVVNSFGFILTTGGLSELTKIISTTVTTTTSVDGTYNIATHNGIVYWIYSNGTVTTD